MGVEAAPSFDKPWLSTSFADYWSRRWNLTTTYMLRVLIYEPIMEGSWFALPKDQQQRNSHKLGAAKLQQQQHVQVYYARSPAAAAAPDGPDSAPYGPESPNMVNTAASDSDSDQSCITSTAATTLNNSTMKPGGDKAAGAAAAADSSPTSSPSASATDLHPAPIKASAATAAGEQQSLLRRRKGMRETGDKVDPAYDLQEQTSKQQQRQHKQKRLLRRFLALQATFAFSAIWHVLIFYYNTHIWTWHWFAFFSLQAPIIIVESLMIRAATARGFSLPRPVSIFLTNFLLIVVANPLFFGPCDWSGMCHAMMASIYKGS